MWGTVSKAGFSAIFSSWLPSPNTSPLFPLGQSVLSTSPARATAQPQLPYYRRAHGLLLNQNIALLPAVLPAGIHSLIPLSTCPSNVDWLQVFCFCRFLGLKQPFILQGSASSGASSEMPSLTTPS